MKAFKEGCKNVSDMPQFGPASVSEKDMHTVSTLVKTDWNFMIHELPERQDWRFRLYFTSSRITRECENWLKMGSIWFNGTVELTTIWCCSYSLAVLWTWRRGLLTTYHYNLWDLDQIVRTETEAQSNEWHRYGSLWNSTVWQKFTNVKARMIVVYDRDGVILKHTIPPKQNISAEYNY